MASNIVVVGSCMIDFVSYAPRLPKTGETIHGREFVTNFGGKGANQCVAAAKLGASTALVARVGDDLWGQKYIDNLKKIAVNTDFVQETTGSSTGIAQIIVSEEGENQIVIVAGANNHLSSKDVELAANLISSAVVVVLQLETSQDVAIETLRLCKKISILNGAPALTEFDPELLKLPTIFCVNESEASVFTGIQVNNRSDAEAAATDLLDKGCNSVLITLGADGATYISKEDRKFVHINSPCVKCVDSTGAGDAFIGALAYRLSRSTNFTMEECIRDACLVAADSVTRPGTQISFPGPEVFRQKLPANF